MGMRPGCSLSLCSFPVDEEVMPLRTFPVREPRPILLSLILGRLEDHDDENGHESLTISTVSNFLKLKNYKMLLYHDTKRCERLYPSQLMKNLTKKNTSHTLLTTPWTPFFFVNEGEIIQRPSLVLISRRTERERESERRWEREASASSPSSLFLTLISWWPWNMEAPLAAAPKRASGRRRFRLDEDAKETKLLPRNCCAKKLVIHRIGLEIQIFFVMWC